MSFKEAKIPNFLVVDFYKNVLITNTNTELTQINSTKKEVIRKSLEFLGENKKNIVIVVEDNEAVFITDEKLQLLTTLLQACNLSIADVAIINIANKNLNYTILKKNLNFEFLLMMGIDSNKFNLPLAFSKNKVQQFNNTQLLITENLKNLMGNSIEVKTEKRALWNALKIMFNIK
jgi:hypothetical protein